MRKKTMNYLALLLITTLMLTGCGASTKYESSDMEYPESAPMEDVMVEEEGVWEEDWEEPTAEEAGIESVDAKNNNRKLIKRYYLSLETREYDKLVDYIQQAVTASGGYVESSNLSGTSIDGNGAREAYFVLRIPVSDADSFVKGLETNGHVTNKTENVEDVTLDYVDTESHIEALRIEQETLLGMLEQVDELEEILILQNRLTEVRYELERYESQLRSYDNLVEYTTVSLDVYEVKRETSTNDGSFSERLADNFKDGFYDFGQSIQEVLIGLAGAIPTLIILALLIALTVMLIRRGGKKRRNKKQMENVMKNASMDFTYSTNDANKDKKDE